MIFEPYAYHKMMLASASYTNGATATSLNFDTQAVAGGIKGVTIALFGTTSNNATNTPAFTLQEADVTNASSFVTVAAGSSGTNAGNFTAPAAPTATTDQPYLVLNIDCRYRKRYLNFTVVPVTTQTFWAVAHAWGERMGQAINSAAQVNAAAVVNL